MKHASGTGSMRHERAAARVPPGELPRAADSEGDLVEDDARVELLRGCSTTRRCSRPRASPRTSRSPSTPRPPRAPSPGCSDGSSCRPRRSSTSRPHDVRSRSSSTGRSRPECDSPPSRSLSARAWRRVRRPRSTARSTSTTTSRVSSTRSHPAGCAPRSVRRGEHPGCCRSRRVRPRRATPRRGVQGNRGTPPSDPPRWRARLSQPAGRGRVRGRGGAGARGDRRGGLPARRRPLRMAGQASRSARARGPAASGSRLHRDLQLPRAGERSSRARHASVIRDDVSSGRHSPRLRDPAARASSTHGGEASSATIEGTCVSGDER